MGSDDKEALIACSFWAIVILFMIIIAYQGVKFVWVKTSSVVSSYQEGAVKREEVKRTSKIAKDKKSRVEDVKKKVALAKAKASEVDAETSKLRQSPNRDEEFDDFDLMFHADGTLRDPVPGDGYTASQNYWILAFALVGVFFVWAGSFSGNPIMFVGSCLFCIIVGLLVMFVW